MWIIINENEIYGKSSNKRKNNKEEISNLSWKNLYKKISFCPNFGRGRGGKDQFIFVQNKNVQN